MSTTVERGMDRQTRLNLLTRRDGELLQSLRLSLLMRRRGDPSSETGGHPPPGGKILQAPTEPADEAREDDSSSKIGRASSMTGREDPASSLGACGEDDGCPVDAGR